MCGLAGIISAGPPVLPDRLKKMTDAIAHRGPDGEGHWIDPSGLLGLGHRRLAIIDLSAAGRQPMHYLGRYTIMHNGEIYNYRELRAYLAQKGYRFSSQTDTEVIAAAYDYYRQDCLPELDGMFSFVIYDEKEKRVFAARDRFGEKPFFYTHSPEEFVFGSEIKALAAGGVRKEVNRKLLFNYLTIGYVDNPTRPEETFYEGIYKLPAAHYLFFDIPSHSLSIHRYWTLDPEARTRERSQEKTEERFLELLTDSVQKRLRSDVPVGTSLSGGLDSSSILALVSETKSAGPVYQSFSAVFPGFEKNEEHFINLASERFGLPNTKSHIREEQLTSLILQVAKHLDEPFGSASNLAQYAVYSLASKLGAKVLLDGQGADEILAGYTRYYKWYWQELFRQRKLYRSGEFAAARKLGINEPFTYKNIIAALFPDLASVVLEKRYLLHAIQHPGLTPEFVKQHSQEAYYDKPSIGTLNGALFYNTCTHGLEELLRYADRNSMAHGIEVRLPFLYHELVEFVFSLPPDFKIRNGYSKWLLRKVMNPLLPEEICWRAEKVGFEPPQKKWMELDAVKSLIQASKQKLVSEGILKEEVMEKRPQAHAAYAREAFDWRYLAAGMLFR